MLASNARQLDDLGVVLEPADLETMAAAQGVVVERTEANFRPAATSDVAPPSGSGAEPNSRPSTMLPGRTSVHLLREPKGWTKRLGGPAA